MQLPTVRCVLSATIVLYCVIGTLQGCHTGHKRRRMFEGSEKLVNFFAQCMTERAGPKYRWEAVVRFSIEDTEWYPDSGNEYCGEHHDTYECWKSQVDFLIDPSSVYGLYLKVCIKAFTDQQRETTIESQFEDDSHILQVTRSGRMKRSITYNDVILFLMNNWRRRLPQQTRSGTFYSPANNRVSSPFPILHSPSPVNPIPAGGVDARHAYQQPIPKMYVPTPKVNGPTSVSNGQNTHQRTVGPVSSPKTSSSEPLNHVVNRNSHIPPSTVRPLAYQPAATNSKFVRTYQQEQNVNPHTQATEPYTTRPLTPKTTTIPAHTQVTEDPDTVDPFLLILRHMETSKAPTTVPATTTPSGKAVGLLNLINLMSRRNNEDTIHGNVMPRVVTSSFCDEEATMKFTQCVTNGVSQVEKQRSSIFISGKYLSKEDVESVVKFFEENHSSCQSLVVEDKNGNLKVRKCKAGTTQQSSTCLPSVMLHLVKDDSKLRNILMSCAS